MSDAFDKVVYNGHLMDKKTKAFLQAMEQALGYPLTVMQGCYTSSNPSSAGTHDQGGVIDLAPWDWQRKVRVGANLGAFIWHRPYLAGEWPEHIHFGIRNHGNLAPDAARQQVDWDAHPPRNGLANHAPMGPNEYHVYNHAFHYPPEKVIKVVQPTKVQEARSALSAAIHDLNKAQAMLDDTDPGRVKARAQLDDLRKIEKDARAVMAALPKK